MDVEKIMDKNEITNNCGEPYKVSYLEYKRVCEAVAKAITQFELADRLHAQYDCDLIAKAHHAAYEELRSLQND